MADDDSSLSASELRNRYLRGGTVKDDELTSAQLRARHAIPSNGREFSTSKKDTDYTGILVVAIIVVICGSILALFLIPMPVH